MDSGSRSPAAMVPRAKGAFLLPIERPKRLLTKLVYAWSLRQVGKVIAPLKVFAARMPTAFGRFYGKINALNKKLQLPSEVQLLIRTQVAKLNVCPFSVDVGRFLAIQRSNSLAKLDGLSQYSTNPLFSDRERAALDYVTELTLDKRVQPGTFLRLAEYYSEREICEIVWLLASEHFYNMTNLALDVHSDMLCDRGKECMANWE
jgi:alkylhydroperoxidase family enzyme